jgi:predicted nuclease of predicted toxin-antitoxin system
VLARAVREQRILLTFDNDFGELVFHSGQKASCGVVLFRITRSSSQALALSTAEKLETRTDWPGHLSTVDDKGVRMVPLP